MYVLRSKVTVTDVSAATRRFGLGGPAAASALRTLLHDMPAPFETRRTDAATVLCASGPALRDRRAPASCRRGACTARRHRDARRLRRLAMAHDPRRRTGRHGRHAGCVRRAGRELGPAGRHRFPEGLLHRAGNHRAHALPRPAQGAHACLPRGYARGIARRQDLQRGVRRPAVRHGGQRGAGPGRRLRPPRRPAARGGGTGRRAALLRRMARRSSRLPLPYAIPAAKAPREREA